MLRGEYESAARGYSNSRGSNASWDADGDRVVDDTSPWRRWHLDAEFFFEGHSAVLERPAVKTDTSEEGERECIGAMGDVNRSSACDGSRCGP